MYYKKEGKKIAKGNDTLSKSHFKGQKSYEYEGRTQGAEWLRIYFFKKDRVVILCAFNPSNFQAEPSGSLWVQN